MCELINSSLKKSVSALGNVFKNKNIPRKKFPQIDSFITGSTIRKSDANTSKSVIKIDF